MKRIYIFIILGIIIAASLSVGACVDSAPEHNIPQIRISEELWAPVSELQDEEATKDTMYPVCSLELFDRQGKQIFEFSYSTTLDQLRVSYNADDNIDELVYYRGQGWDASVKYRILFKYNEEGGLSGTLYGLNWDAFDLDEAREQGAWNKDPQPRQYYDPDGSLIEELVTPGTPTVKTIIRYNGNGRPIEETTYSDDQLARKTNYDYREDLSLLEESCYFYNREQSDYSLMSITIFDRNEDIVECTAYDFTDEPGNERILSSVEFQYLKYDDFGNWIERSRLSTGGINEGEFVGHRTINYYGDPPLYFE